MRQLSLGQQGHTPRRQAPSQSGVWLRSSFEHPHHLRAKLKKITFFMKEVPYYFSPQLPMSVVKDLVQTSCKGYPSPRAAGFSLIYGSSFWISSRMSHTPPAFLRLPFKFYNCVSVAIKLARAVRVISAPTHVCRQAECRCRFPCTAALTLPSTTAACR